VYTARRVPRKRRTRTCSVYGFRPDLCRDVMVLGRVVNAIPADMACSWDYAAARGAVYPRGTPTMQLGPARRGGMSTRHAELGPRACPKSCGSTSNGRAGLGPLRAGDFSVIAAYDGTAGSGAADREAAFDVAAGAGGRPPARPGQTILTAGVETRKAELATAGWQARARSSWAPWCSGHHFADGHVEAPGTWSGPGQHGIGRRRKAATGDVLRTRDGRAWPRRQRRLYAGRSAGSWCTDLPRLLTPNCSTRATATWRRVGTSSPPTCSSQTPCTAIPLTWAGRGASAISRTW